MLRIKLDGPGDFPHERDARLRGDEDDYQALGLNYWLDESAVNCDRGSMAFLLLVLILFCFCFLF